MTLARLRTLAAAAALGAGLVAAAAADAAPRFRAPALALPVPGAFARPAGVVDVDLDGTPEIAAGSSAGLHLFRRADDGTWSPVSTVLAGSSVTVIATGNGDGNAWPDLVVLEQVGAELRYRILMGDGSGHVPSSAFAVLPNVPLRQCAGDFDGDGRLDVVSHLVDEGELRLHRNDGAGGLGSDAPWTSPIAFPGWVHAADLDADGNLDLVLSGGGAAGDSMAVLPGNGDGTFDAPLLAPGRGALAFGAFDDTPGLDGIFRGAGTSIELRSGNGAGGFGSGSPVATGVALEGAAGDFDGDGELDVVLARGDLNQVVQVALGDGKGAFVPGVAHSAGGAPAGLVVAEVTGDGRLDVIVASQTAGVILVYPGNGDATFGSPLTPTTPDVRDVALADLDGDGTLDAASVDEVAGQVTTWTGAGDGRFTSPTATATGGAPVTLAIARVDGDAFPDVLVPVSGQLRLFRNDGAGGLLAPTSTAISGAPRSIAVGDLDSDGDADVVLPASSSGVANVLLGDGAGGFAAAPPITGLFTRAVIARFGPDAVPDVALANGAQVTVHTGTGTGAFSGPLMLALPAGSTAGTLEAADADGDGDVDLFACMATGAPTIAYWANDGAGGFAARVDLDSRPFPANPNQAALLDLRVRDFDEDGAGDLLVAPAMATRMLGLLAGAAPGTFAPVRVLGGSNTIRALDAGDVDGDGDIDLVVVGSATSGAPGTLSTLLNEQDLVGVPEGPGPKGPGGVSIAAAWPVPARGGLTLRFRVPTGAEVRIALFSASGRRVALQSAMPAAPGEQVVRLDGLGGLPAGVYAAVVEQAGRRAARKVVLLP